MAEPLEQPLSDQSKQDASSSEDAQKAEISPTASERSAAPKKATLLKRALVGLCAALVVVVCVAAASTLFGKDEGGLAPDPNVKIGSLTGAGVDLEKIAEEAQVSFSINAAPVFETGSAPGNLTIENLEINNNRFTVAINLNEDGREVYRSGLIDPGQYIESAPLQEVLPAGEYPAVATIETFRLSDNTPIGSVAAELVLHVKG